MSSTAPLTRIVGIYDADGGPIGEARYILGRLFGATHCALCDITHSPVRRKAAWDRMVRQRGIPVTLLHRNEVPEQLLPLTEQHGLPLVIGLSSSGAEVLVDPAGLDRLAGSVEAFDDQLGRALERRAQPAGPPAEEDLRPAS